MMQRRPLGPRKTVQLTVALTILAWATQTLIRQWGFGGIIFPAAPEVQSLGEAPAATQPAAPDFSSLTDGLTLSTRRATAAKPEAAVTTPETTPAKSATVATPATVAAVNAAVNPPPAQATEAAGPTVELRCETTIDGGEVTLKQLCRWTDDQAMSKFGDIVIARLSQTNPVRQIGVAEIKQALHDAGANLSQIQFAGSASCAVRRCEVDDATFARLLSEHAKAVETATAAQSTPSADASADPLVADVKQTPLFELLMTDLSDRLKLPAEALEVRFDVRGQPDLMLMSPRCRFDIDSQRITALGAVSWDVKIHSPTGERSATIIAIAQAWQYQLTLNRPLSAGQKVRASDVATRRTLVDKLADHELAADASQIAGQVLAADMKRGDVLFVNSVKGENLVFKDQFVTVAFPHDGAMIETVARALESGSRGQVVRVRNESTNQVYSIVVTDKAAGEVRMIEGVASTPRESATDR